MLKSLALALIAALVAVAVAWMLVAAGESMSATLWLLLAHGACGLWLAHAAYVRITGGNRQMARLVSLATALPLLGVIWLAAGMIANNLRLARFSAQLFEYPLPRGAQRIDTDTAVGILRGNGNHCDFAATLFIDSGLLFDAIREHYAGLNLRPAIPGGAPPTLDVRSTGNPVGRTAVVLMDGGYEGSPDLRCH